MKSVFNSNFICANIVNIFTNIQVFVNLFSMIKERIIQFVDSKGITKESFYNRIGMTSANFRGKAKETPINSTAIENILSEFPDLNLEWLITGKGEMTKSNFQSVKNEGKTSNQNNINAPIEGNVSISQNDLASIIEIQRELNDIIRTTQCQLTESQKQVSDLIKMLNK